MRLIFLIALFFSSSMCLAENLIQTASSLGKLQLEKGRLISVQLLQDKFPSYKVAHQIVSGFTKKHHYIKVTSQSGEFMFSIGSFFDEEIDEKSLMYDIDQLVIYSSKISDQFGIKVGDNLAQVFSARGKNLELLAPNLFRNAVGKDLIYYQFQMPSDNSSGYRDPESVTLQEVINANPSITSISWPWARTE